MKIIAVLFFLFIVYSLASALFYMVKDKGQSTRMLKSLTLRIGLSVVLFIILMTGYYFGILPARE
ncbi:MAG: twin transmembrane helix small protein [Nitrosomonadaceae bacterium]